MHTTTTCVSCLAGVLPSRCRVFSICSGPKLHPLACSVLLCVDGGNVLPSGLWRVGPRPQTRPGSPHPRSNPNSLVVYT